jgi:hypothetical protein
MPGMKASLCFCLVLIGGLVATPQTSHKVSITILVLNGANGRPVWGESPNIWVDDESRLNPRTNLLGKTKIYVSSDVNEIKISPNWGHECRGGDNPQARTDIRYSVAEVLRTGVVTLNLCGKSTRKPEPGVLIFYERPSTWKERWDS